MKLHLWNGNKALTLVAIVLIIFFAWKFYEAKEELEFKHSTLIQGVRLERTAQIDSLKAKIDTLNCLVDTMKTEVDWLTKELRDK